MKKILHVLLVLLLAASLVLGGCASAGSEAPAPEAPGTDEPPAEEPAEPLKVALILPGPINDGGWNTSGYEGLMLIEEEFGAQVAYNENTPVSDYDEVYRGYAIQGFDIVIGHSSNFADSAKRVAPEFPDTHFVVTSTALTQEPNLSSIANDNAQQGFLMGVVAAVVSESGIVGGIGSTEISSIIDSLIGYEAGAKYINPDIQVMTTYTGNHDDAAGAKEIAFSMIDQGADVLMANANAASLGVMEAGQERDIKLIGSIGDMSQVAPDHVVTSGRTVMSTAFKAFVDAYLQPGFKADAYIMGLNENVVFLNEYNKFEDRLTDEQKATIQSVVDGLKDGSIDPRDYAEFSI